MTRDDIGKVVRDAWIKWAKTQENPKESWLVPYSELPEDDKEADRCIGDALAHYFFDRIGEDCSDTIQACIYDAVMPEDTMIGVIWATP